MSRRTNKVGGDGAFRSVIFPLPFFDRCVELRNICERARAGSRDGRSAGWMDDAGGSAGAAGRVPGPADAAGSATIQMTPASQLHRSQATRRTSSQSRSRILTVGPGVRTSSSSSYDETHPRAGGRGERLVPGQHRAQRRPAAMSRCPGTVHLRCNTNQSASSGATGSGQLAQIRFEAIATGDSPLYFTPIVRCLEPLGIGEGYGDTSRFRTTAKARSASVTRRRRRRQRVAMAMADGGGGGTGVEPAPDADEGPWQR